MASYLQLSLVVYFLFYILKTVYHFFFFSQPENILLVNHSSHQVKIIDFGLARRYDLYFYTTIVLCLSIVQIKISVVISHFGTWHLPYILFQWPLCISECVDPLRVQILQSRLTFMVLSDSSYPPPDINHERSSKFHLERLNF